MQMADVNLSKAVRTNLLSLQSTAAQMSKTQNRLATGLKVNSALDNPSNFFTASALNSRAGDMANLMDSMASGIQTIEAADNGLKSITKTVESMQSTLRQARQDKSFKTESYALGTGLTSAQNISFSGGAVGSTEVDIALGTAAVGATPATYDGASVDLSAADPDLSGLDGETVSVNGSVVYTFTNSATGQKAALDTALETATGGTATLDATGVHIDVATGENFSIQASDAAVTTATGIAATLTTTTDGVEAVAAAAKTVDQLVSTINNNNDLKGKIRASNDNGSLRIENLSTEELSVNGVNSNGVVDGVDIASADDQRKIGGNDVRKNLAEQFNALRDQLDKFSDDASFNGINLLRGDKLKLTFNETGTSTIEIQAKDKDNQATQINSASLDIDSVVAADFDSDTKIDTKLDGLKASLDTLRSQASTFGSNLSVVENRQDFTKNMINTLETGAANLTLADTNEEAANLLALQTRQQLSSTALSMASQADQAVLRLF
jgi:flagellin